MQVDYIPALKDNYIWVISSQSDNFYAIVDPSLSEPVFGYCKSKNITPNLILNTHHHYDHVGGNEELKQKFDCEVIGPAYDEGRIPGMDRGVKDQEEVQVGPFKAQVFFIPGHTSGHIAFWFKQQNALFCGDTLFSIGCGRLFEGSPQQMWESLKRLKQLPPQTKIYCAHEYTYDNLRFALSLQKNHPELLKKIDWTLEKRDQGLPTLPAVLQEELELNPFLKADHPEMQKALGWDNNSKTPVEVFTQLRKLKDNFN